jgi:lysophospholipase L1-like esterase
MISVCVPAAGAESSKPPEEFYVVLGDSLAIGFEPDMKVDAVPYGYSDRVYEQALMHGRASFANYGIGGLTSAGFKNFIQAVAEEKTISSDEIQPNLPDTRVDSMMAEVSRIKSDIAAADMITLTIGGNDVKNEILTKFVNLSDEDFEVFVDDWMKSYAESLTSVLTNIYALNQNVRIYAADQYSPYPKLNEKVYLRTQKMKDRLTETLKALEQEFRGKGFQLTTVPVAQAFVGKELQYTYILGKQNPHPNQRGYALIAEVFAKTIWGEHRTDVKKTEPISVVVGGRSVDTPHVPALIGGTTFVPLREYSEALGAKVEWDAKTQTATVIIGDNRVALTIDSDVITVNGVPQQVKTAVPHFHQSAGESKTYVPLRLMAEGVGFDVKYVLQSKTAYINP